MKTYQSIFAYLEEQSLKKVQVDIEKQNYQMMCMCCF